jgi:hypothetical protein
MSISLERCCYEMLSPSITANVPVNGKTVMTCREHTAVYWKSGHHVWTETGKGFVWPQLEPIFILLFLIWKKVQTYPNKLREFLLLWDFA